MNGCGCRFFSRYSLDCMRRRKARVEYENGSGDHSVDVHCLTTYVGRRACVVFERAYCQRIFAMRYQYRQWENL